MRYIWGMIRGILFLVCVVYSSGLWGQSLWGMEELVAERKQVMEQPSKKGTFLLKDDWKQLDLFSLSALVLLQGYKSFVSADLGSDCRFSPSCSAFSAAIIREKGFYKGIWLTADRLIRCNPEAEYDHCPQWMDQHSGLIRDEATAY